MIAKYENSNNKSTLDRAKGIATEIKDDINRQSLGFHLSIIGPTGHSCSLEDPPVDSPFIINDNKKEYQWKRTTGNTEYIDKISNFIIIPLYLLISDSMSKRVWKLVNNKDEETTLCIPSKALSRMAEFSAITEGRGNFVPAWKSFQFPTIKEYLYSSEIKAEEILILGYQPKTGYYAFANGIYNGKSFYQTNDYGIVEIGSDKFYLPAYSVVNENAENEYRNERKFIFQQSGIDFKVWSSYMIDIFSDNGIAGICFVIAAIFRDVIFKHCSCFPLLFLFGPKGTGKSTYRRIFKVLFGKYEITDAIGLGSASSPKGFSRKLAQIKNGLEAFEEYKNKIDPRIIEMLKNIYDGIGYERAQSTNDLKTHSTGVNSAVIVSGQEMPNKENALFSRMIMLSFQKESFSDKEKEVFNQLKDITDNGLGAVLLEILSHRKHFEKTYSKSFQTIYSRLRNDSQAKDLDDRSLTNITSILGACLSLSNVLVFPFSFEEAYEVFRDIVVNQYSKMERTNEVNQFWEAFAYLQGEGILYDRHYRVDKEDSVIYIHMPSIYPKYREYAVKNNINVLDKETLVSYLSIQNYFKEGEKEGRRKTIRIRMIDGQKRCLAFFFKGLGLEFLEKKEE